MLLGSHILLPWSSSHRQVGEASRFCLASFGDMTQAQ